MSQGKQPRQPDPTDAYFFYQSDEDRVKWQKFRDDVLEIETWEDLDHDGLKQLVMRSLQSRIDSEAGILARVSERHAQVDWIRLTNHVFALAIRALKKERRRARRD